MSFYELIYRRGHSLLVATFISVTSLFLTASTVKAEGRLQKGDLVAVCGDSITQQRIYTLFIEDYLLMCQPEADLQMMQFGRGGETVPWFLPRQKYGCLPFRPTVATTCYGMNDGVYKASDPSRLDLYKNSLSTAVKNFKDAGVRFIVVGAPGVVDSDTCKQADPLVYNNTLRDFAETARQVANEQGVAFADVHSIMMDVMAKAKAKYGKGYAFAGKDGVHPGPNGHLVMAYAFLKALGCDGDIGTITVDLKANHAKATTGHSIISVANGNIELESTRYPFCFFGDPDKETARSIIEFLPFNEDLNRYKLVVNNATTPKLKVTWGQTSKVYAASDLEKGINLALEFINNPFSEPFATAEASLKAQQEFETTASMMLTSLQDWRKTVPDQEDTYVKMEQAVHERSIALRKSSRAAVIPVKHSIKIEPAQ